MKLMIISEQFECTPGSGNAIKDRVLSGVGTALDNDLVLGDVTSWITATATSLVVLGAFWAGKIALDTLKHM